MEAKSKKFKAVATLTWDFESHGDADREARAYLEGLFTKFLPEETSKGWSLKVRVHPVIEERPKRIALGEVAMADVLDYVSTEPNAEREYVVGGVAYLVKMTSLRYQVFKRDHCRCVCCGLAGTKMVLEKRGPASRAHFNLYGIEDGREVLFTKDHVIPLAHGGTGRLDNLQTMCTICNILKGCARRLSMESNFPKASKTYLGVSQSFVSPRYGCSWLLMPSALRRRISCAAWRMAFSSRSRMRSCSSGSASARRAAAEMETRPPSIA
jgi:hypothetical protein